MSARPPRRPALQLAAAVLALGSVAALSACGGGGDSTPSASATPSTTTPVVTPAPETPTTTVSRIDAYVGTWRSPCIPVNGTYSANLVATATKVSDTQMSVRNTTATFATLDCSGDVVSTGDQGTDTYTLTGTATIDTKVVDKVVVTRNGSDSKNIAYTDGTTLLFGGSDVDSDGYPTSLNSAYPFTRQ